MVLPYAELMQLERRSRFSWTERDAIIYALGVAAPSDPFDMRQSNKVSLSRGGLRVAARRRGELQ